MVVPACGDELRLTLTPPLAVLTLTRAARLNALSPSLIEALVDAAQRLGAADDCHVVLLRGEGRVFCAGFDLDTLPAAASITVADADLGRRLIDAWSTLPQLAVAAVHGACVGGGLLLAAACDLRIAAAGTRFAVPELELGLPLTWGGVPRLVRLLGPTLAAQVLFDASPFDAGQALAWRLVNRVVDAPAFETAAQDWATQLARHPGFVLRATKRRLAAAVEALSPALGDARDAADLIAARADPQADAALQRYLAARRG
jgi:enoyl-CoA hydratase/carnithine racemase